MWDHYKNGEFMFNEQCRKVYFNLIDESIRTLCSHFQNNFTYEIRSQDH